MAPVWRSTEEEFMLWEEVEEDFGSRCRRHATQPRYGVCPSCLKERLLRLCPECAHLRPCRCLDAAGPSSSYASSSASSSSVDLARSAGEDSCEAGREIGAIGSVLRLIESEPAFCRSRSVGMPLLQSKSVGMPLLQSRSVGMPFLRSRSVAASIFGDDAPASETRREKKGRIAFWPFRRSVDGKKQTPPDGKKETSPDGKKESPPEEVDPRLPRSRSVFVGISRFPDSGGCGEVKTKGGGWGRYIPGRMKVFRLRKATIKFDQEVSPPACRA